MVRIAPIVSSKKKQDRSPTDNAKIVAGASTRAPVESAEITGIFLTQIVRLT